MLYSKYYGRNMQGALHDTLQVMQPTVDMEFAVTPGVFEARRQWYCRCLLCGKSHLFTTEDFVIKHAKGNMLLFYCSAHCDCHTVTSFDWMVLDMIRMYGMRCVSHVSVPCTFSDGARGNLVFDFCVGFGKLSQVKALVDFRTNDYFLRLQESNCGYDRIVRDAKKSFCEEHHIQYVSMVRSDALTPQVLERRMQRNRILVKTSVDNGSDVCTECMTIDKLLKMSTAKE